MTGGVMGGGCQGKRGDAVYAHALPPSRNAGTMLVFEQRAYFSAWRMVCDVPSVMTAMLFLPCGFVTGGLLLRSFWAFTRALGT